MNLILQRIHGNELIRRIYMAKVTVALCVPDGSVVVARALPRSIWRLNGIGGGSGCRKGV